MSKPGKKTKRSALERVFRLRVDNMRLLAKSYSTRNDFARALDVLPSYLSHIIGETPIKAIGENFARDAEVKLGLHRGWLDMPH